jgi:hypothetical protein
MKILEHLALFTFASPSTLLGADFRFRFDCLSPTGAGDSWIS